MKRKHLVIITALFVFLVGAVVWLWLPFRAIGKLDSRYRQIQPGMSVADVTSIMDHAGSWRESDFKAWWDAKPLGESADVRIRRAVRYGVSTFYLPVTFEFTFDTDGKVLGRHRYD